REEVLGRNVRLTKSGVQDDAFYRTLWTTILGGKTWHGRMVNRRKDGALFSEEVIISPVRDSAGTVTAYVAVKRDISDRLALEAQLLHAQKMESIGRLAAGVAHDFNNLLTVILSHAAFGLACVGSGDPVRENLLEVRKAGERGAALTRQLLVFSRKRASQRQPLDLNVVITDLKRMLQTLIGEDIEVVHLPAAAPCWVNANIGEIEQMIMNLAVNARDAMREGGRFTLETANVAFDPTAAAQHDGAAPGRYVQLTVSDSGLGMDERTMAQAFEPFFTTKVAGKGTGLGLSIVYSIVQQSGGSISVRSQVGLGTTFTVCLPHGTPGPGVAELPPMETVRRGRCTETILVAEDEEALRKAVVRILTAAGYAVLDAIDAKDALAIGASHRGRIDLLLSDMVMPHTSGRLLALALARERPDIKVLFMSGYASELVDDQLRGGADVHLLAKPFSSSDLTTRVRMLLDGNVSDRNRNLSGMPEHC
ncbi:MAG: ATP-binding protein, partial [Myxococcota bacterium]